MLASAEADFRANDRDGKGKNDFWRNDIAGLFTVCPPGTSKEDSAEQREEKNFDRALRQIARLQAMQRRQAGR